MDSSILYQIIQPDKSLCGFVESFWTLRSLSGSPRVLRKWRLDAHCECNSKNAGDV